MRERPAERVQPEQRVRPGHHRGRGDGDCREEIPAHHLAKRLIEAHAVHVDRQPLRRAEQGRGRVAAIVEVGLERIALDLVDMHAVEPAVEEVGEVERAAGGDLAVGRGLDRRRDLFERQLDARERRHFGDGDGVGYRWDSRRCLRARRRLDHRRGLGPGDRRRSGEGYDEGRQEAGDTVPSCALVLGLHRERTRLAINRRRRPALS